MEAENTYIGLSKFGVIYKFNNKHYVKFSFKFFFNNFKIIKKFLFKGFFEIEIEIENVEFYYYYEPFLKNWFSLALNKQKNFLKKVNLQTAIFDNPSERGKKYKIMSSIYENNEKIMKINFNIKEIQIVVLCIFEKIDFLKDMFEINIEKIFLNDNEINIENTFDENRFSLFKITELIINKNINKIEIIFSDEKHVSYIPYIIINEKDTLRIIEYLD